MALTYAMISFSIALGNALRGKAQSEPQREISQEREVKAQRMQGGNIFEGVTYFLLKALLRNISRYACSIVNIWKERI